MTPFSKSDESSASNQSSIEQQPPAQHRGEPPVEAYFALPASVLATVPASTAMSTADTLNDISTAPMTPHLVIGDDSDSDSSSETENTPRTSSNNKNSTMNHTPVHYQYRHEPHPSYCPPRNQSNRRDDEYNLRHNDRLHLHHDNGNCIARSLVGTKTPKQQDHQQPRCNYTETNNTSLPTLPFHSHQELSLAERSIRKLIKNSQFFPPRAAENNWFQRPCGDNVKFVPLKSSSSEEEDITPVSEEETTHVTALYEREVRVEKLLGKGGFCEVRLTHIILDDDNSNRTVIRSCSDLTSAAQCYAIKYLSPTIAQQKSKRAFSRGAADLAIEARFLSLLSHENIIQLHHVSAGSLRENYNCLDTHEDSEKNASCYCCDSSNGRGNKTPCFCDNQFSFNLRHLGYFLILDKLDETLDHRMKHAFVPEVVALTGQRPGNHHDSHRCCSDSSHMHHSTGHQQQRRWLNGLPQWMSHIQQRNAALVPGKDPMKDLLAKRLIILRSIASAVKYLHDHHILFRDIKPDNIGFYCGASGEEGKGIPKLFDFGLVKEVKQSSRVTSMSFHRGKEGEEDATYKLTGRTGSRRYMSPEVAFSQPYNYKADIYSFGILLYEMSTLMQPFIGYTIHRHEIEVLRKGHRPCLAGYNHYWPMDLAGLIEDCWSGDMKDRPGINEVLQRLDVCIHELTTPIVMKKDDSANKIMSPRSLLAGISQCQLPSSQREMPATPPSSAGFIAEDDQESKGKNKLKQFVSLLPPYFLRKNTAPQA